MASPRGCFKTGCFGCLGIIVLLLLIVGVTALMAWNGAKNSDPRDEVLAPLAANDSALLAGRSGRVVLNMAQGEFRIHSAQPGEGLRVEAVYDAQLYHLEQDFTTQPDSTWQFELEFDRTGSGMRTFLQSMFSNGPSTTIHVFLPPDVPVELVADVAKGALVGDLGGLWLTSADLRMRQGGIELEFSEPTKKPMSSLRLRFSMGGGVLEGLGNASPKKLDVTSSMGGAEVDLSGMWLNDCDVNISAKMGGMTVNIPRGVEVLRGAEARKALPEFDPELREPVLRLRTKAQYGEVEVIH